MITKNQIKFIRSLEQKKFRKEHGLFIAEGKKIVNEILNSRLKIHSFFATKNFHHPRVAELASEKFVIDETELEKISLLATPNEVLCLVEIPKNEIIFDKIKQHLSLFLDNIKDPGNLGNIIRIADWFGIEYVFCTPGCVDAYNPKTVQATMGSIARVKIVYEELENITREVKTDASGPFTVYAATLGGKNIYREKLVKKGLIILGNESEGISERLIHMADRQISIPSFGEAESLNVAASSAIICSEFRRRNFS